MRTIDSISREAIARLKGVLDSPLLDIQILLADILKRNRAWILSHPEYELSLEQVKQFNHTVQRLENGEPLPYILGRWEFYGLELTVSPDTLIPRPESEILVEQALAWLRNHSGQRLGVDVGTGSGCVAVSLAYHHPSLSCLATDISSQAIKIARKNVERYHLSDRVYCLLCDLLPPIKAKIDLICANLPYIPTQRLRGLKIYDKEPTLALNGGAQGLELITRFLQQLGCRLSSVGLILLEIDSSQRDLVMKIARETFPNERITCISDLSGQPRVISIQGSG